MSWSIGFDRRWNRDSPCFYTYMWLREDRTPYYVGKGSGNRAFKKRLRRIGYPPPPERIVIAYHESEAVAFESEKALILQHGRKDLGTGCLANLTAGGDNPPNHLGKTRSAEWHRKQSLKKKGRIGAKQSEATRNKRRQAMLGRTFSATSIERMRQAQIGKRHTEETKAKLSLLHRGMRLGVPWSAARREALERSKQCPGQ